MMTVPSPQGNGRIRGYLVKPAKPSKEGKPGVILVVHENRGLNPYIEDVARRLAALGYIAFAPDGLTSVGGYPGDDEKGGEAFKKVDRAKMTEDFLAAARWLKASKEGVKVGWFRPAGADLEITGQRLDGQAPPLKAHVPCCYPTRFQATGLSFPTEGCWEVTARAAESELSFVVWVEP